MKKKREILFPYGDEMRLKLRKMKLTLLLTFLVIASFGNGFSQVTLSLHFDGANIRDVLGSIEKKTDYIFLYKDEIFNGSKEVTVDFENAKFEEVLKSICEQSNVDYEIRDRQIILKEKVNVSLPLIQQQPQKKEISGTVKDSKGLSLPGATVMAKGTTTGTITDANGQFRFALPVEAKTLVFSFVGMKTREISLSGQNKIDLVMEDATANLSEMVVIGYGTIHKTDLTGSVGVVSVKDLAKAPVASFADALAGRVAGVVVNSNDGQPGSPVNIIIRGRGSLTQSVAPLFVIDGYPIEDLDPVTLNPEEIESMTILKDASSTAIYGSRGANGVIVIQTKRGQTSKPVVSFSSSMGFQSTPKPLELMSPYEFIKYQQELNPTSSTTQAFFANGKTLEDYRNVKGLNLQDYLLKTGVTQIYDLALRGGTDQTKYSISGSYYDQDGTIINTGLKRYSGRVTIDQTISKKIKAGISANYSLVDQSGQIINQGQVNQTSPTSYVLAAAWMYRPISPFVGEDLLNDLFDAAATSIYDLRINPVISQENQSQHNFTNLIETNAYVSYNITKDLIFKSTVGIRHNKYTTQAFYNSMTVQGSPNNPINLDGINGAIWNVLSSGFSNSNALTFNKTFHKDHTLTVLGLFETSSTKTAGDGYGGRLLPNEVLGISGLEEGVLFSGFSSSSMSTLVSYAGRVDYNYKSKYMVTGTFRGDGSSKFPKSWGYFPSAALAWNMQNEGFFAKALPFISTSKLRAGYGSTGNNRIGDFDYAPTLSFNNSTNGYSFNNATPTGAVYVSNVGNIDLKWETVKTLDLGYELGLFKDRIRLEVDLYRKTTSDLLLKAPLPTYTGFVSAVKNIGELRNDGLEFTLNTFNINTPSFKWQSNFNISFNMNKVMALTNGQANLASIAPYYSSWKQPLYLAEIGKSSGMMIGYIWEGNYQYPDFDNPSPGVYILKPSIAANGAGRNTIQPGDIKYKDINGDGTMTNADMTFIGRGQPIHTGGFSNNFTYKGFDLNVFFQWSYGNDNYNANRLLMEGNSIYANINQYASYENRWSPTNQTNENYRTRGIGPIGFHSSKNVEDGSFLRLKTVSLRYTVPERFIKKTYLSNLSLNVSGQNLKTWTNYSGMDPEVSGRNNVLMPGFDYSSYPRSPIVVFGLKASF